MKKLIIALLVITSTVHADTFGTGANEFSIDFVDIGYAGNTADTTGYGAVGYDYRMGKYEVTIDQFAKARAADSRIGDGDEGYWNDGTRTVGANAPASQTSWYEGAKFANWLTTGNAYNGVYQFDGGGTFTGVNRSFRNGNDLAYVLPTEDEWHKAAYYKPVDDGSYSLYANGSDDVADLTWGTANGWNYENGDGQFVNGSPNYMWETGYGAEEQNGTHDMMGNVWEWSESALDGTLDNMTEFRAIRGGYAINTEEYLRSSNLESGYDPGGEVFRYGFRVAVIPEPSSALLIALVGGLGLFVRRRFLIV